MTQLTPNIFQLIFGIIWWLIGIIVLINTLKKFVMSQIVSTTTNETFDHTWPFAANYNVASGFCMHYVDEGTGSKTLLLLHGEPTWSYLFRKQISEWSKNYRVIAVDHMGFGKSETPQNRTYWLQDHINNLERFVLDLDLDNLTLVMHDFGGPTGMGLAIRHPERIKQLVSINGPTPAGQPDLVERLVSNASQAPWFQWILKAEKDGILEQVLGHLNYNILSTLKLNGFENNQIISESWLDAYRAPFATPKDSAGAIGWAKGFATNKHQFEIPDEKTRQILAAKPALAVWGEKDHTLHHQEFLPLFKQVFPHGVTHVLPEVGHYSPEDAPEKITKLVHTFVES